MTQLTLDASALLILPKLTESVELLDESGKTLGQFHPTPSREARRSPFSREEIERRRTQQSGSPSPHTREELEQLRLQRTGRPLADIRRDLGAS